MKKFLLTLALFFYLTINSGAQAYQPFPTGSATWEVLRCFYFYPSGWYDKYTFTMDGTDTLNNGESFKKIFVTNHHLPGTVHDSIYPTEFFGGLREVDKQIFIYQVWASTDTSVQLVYDFNNTDVGDTIYTNVLSGNPNLLGHLVTETDSVLVGTQFHKRLLLQDLENSYNTEYWIEGVGSSWGLPFSSFWSITDNSYDLSCFYENQEVKYQNPSPTFGFCTPPFPTITCELVSGITSEQGSKQNLFSVHPNPASDELTLIINDPDFREMSLNIYAVTGVLVRSLTVNQSQLQINVGDLNNGIYFVVLQSGASVESQRLIVQR